jgi:hypothetical protein
MGWRSEKIGDDHSNLWKYLLLFRQNFTLNFKMSSSSSSSSSSRSPSPEILFPCYDANQPAMTDEELDSLIVAHPTERGDCSICKEDILVGQVRMLPCLHIYHENCVFPWLRIHPSCPLCRHQLKEEPCEWLVWFNFCEITWKLLICSSSRKR